jgi:hypothetical protein
VGGLGLAFGVQALELGVELERVLLAWSSAANTRRDS